MFGFDIGVNVRAPQRFIAKHFQLLSQVTSSVFMATPKPLGYGFSQDGIAAMYATPLVVFPFCVESTRPLIRVHCADRRHRR